MIKPLTSLRFLFAMMVFCSHLDFIKPMSSKGMIWLYDKVLQEGYIGVTFFFILSGFILAYTYQQRLIEKKTQYREFMISRIARIYPMHIITLVAAIPWTIVSTSTPHDVSIIAVLLSNISLTQSFIPYESFYYALNGVSWSISDEMFFYALFPFIVTRWHILPQKFFLPVFGLAVLAIPILMIIPTPLDLHYNFYINPFFRVIDFGIGIALFGIYKKIKLAEITWRQASLLELTTTVVLILFFIPHHAVAPVFRYSCYYWIPISSLILVFSLQKGILSRLLSTKLLVVLGEISFGFYLLHILVIRYFLVLNGMLLQWGNVYAILTVVFCITVILSYVSHCFVEKPLATTLKKRWVSHTTQ